jgi:FKBP-type peptidyl-prolyl cis-trans isomerase
MRFSLILGVSIAGVLGSCLKTHSVIDPTGAQYVKDTTDISAYIKQNNIAATKLPQGVWFIIDSLGKGIRPTFNDSIKMTYTKRLLADNSLVEQVTTPKHFVVDSVMLGLGDALPQFPVGSKGRIFVPSFFTNGYGVLYATASVIVQFHLVGVSDYQLRLDTTTINTYLKKNSILTSRDESGLRYKTDTIGTGDLPLLKDDVTVNYVAKNLADSTVVDQEKGITFHLTSLILGWQIGLQKMREGSSYTFYLPSSLCYGPNGNGTTIKGKTNLIFNVKLLKVTHR